jgi:23S rRNA (guanosine2251-2'-O)-methyltransferase
MNSSLQCCHETLRRTQVFQLLVAEGAQQKGRLAKSAGRPPQMQVERPAAMDRCTRITRSIAGSRRLSRRDELEILERARGRGEQPFLLLLDSLNDPQNFGALLRTAEAVGVHGVILPLAHTVEVTPAVVNASSGASEHLLVARSNLAQAIEALKAEDVWIVGLDQAGAELETGMRHLNGALALVVGSEGEGIRPLVRSKCDILLRLPMRGQVESLNAAVAGSVALYLAALTRKS